MVVGSSVDKSEQAAIALLFSSLIPLGTVYPGVVLCTSIDLLLSPSVAVMVAAPGFIPLKKYQLLKDVSPDTVDILELTQDTWLVTSLVFPSDSIAIACIP